MRRGEVELGRRSTTRLPRPARRQSAAVLYAMPAHALSDRDLVRIGKERVESVRPLSPRVHRLRNAPLTLPLRCCARALLQVSATDFPGHHPGESHHWDLDHFRSNLRVQVNSLSPSALEFDLVGVDASVANAIRRIMIAEVRRFAVAAAFLRQSDLVPCCRSRPSLSRTSTFGTTRRSFRTRCSRRGLA